MLIINRDESDLGSTTSRLYSLTVENTRAPTNDSMIDNMVSCIIKLFLAR